MKNTLVFCLVFIGIPCLAQKPFMSLDEHDGFLSDANKQILKETFASKRIVALGEATHGTHEFFKTKTMLIQFLIKECGFRIFGMETQFSAYAINEYILGKHNDLSSVMSDIYTIYHTQEVVDLIRWLRSYNLSVPKQDQVKFYGIDSQHIGNLLRQVSVYVQHVDPLYAKECAERLQVLHEDLKSVGRSKYLKNLQGVADHVRESKRGYITLSSEEEFDVIVKMLDVIVKMLDVIRSAIEQTTRMNSHNKKSQSIRDEAMAENVRWILRHEGSASKIILWAHNGHIQKVKYDLKIEDHIRMGSLLSESFGQQYYALGFDFGKGSFNAIDYTTDSRMQACEVFNEQTDSFAARFNEISESNIFVDFTRITDSLEQQKLSTVRTIRQSGIGFSGDKFTFVGLEVKKAFDGIIYIANTTPSKFVDVRKLR